MEGRNRNRQAVGVEQQNGPPLFRGIAHRAVDRVAAGRGGVIDRQHNVGVVNDLPVRNCSEIDCDSWRRMNGSGQGGGGRRA